MSLIGCHRYWLTSRNWTEGFKAGDCSGQDTLKPELCRFTSSWLSDDVDVTDEEALDLIDLAAEANKDLMMKSLIILTSLTVILMLICKACCCKSRANKEKLS